jgi:hypothetical protein
MDRRQLVTQRARDYFGDRVDDVLEMVRQDRQEMRGWQEPAHVRAVLRRAARGQGAETSNNPTTTALRPTPAGSEAARAAGEPDRGQQREAVGLLLEAGAAALENVAANAANDLTPEEVAGLECVLLLYGRPAVEVNDDGLAAVPPLWNLLEDQREDVELAARGVGRVELLGHPELDWAGTGFLVADGVLMTTRRIAELFGEMCGEVWQFRPGITAWMDYRGPCQSVANAGYRVRGVVGALERYDLALLEVERPPIDGVPPAPLSLAARPPLQTDGRLAYLIGYPVRDARRTEPEAVARVFRDVYNVKRVQPGLLRGQISFHEVRLLRHDCAPLGQTAGSPLLDLETHQVLGMQTVGRYLEGSTAVPLYTLTDEPLLRRAGVTFTAADPRERQGAFDQLDRLARTRYWNEARAYLAGLYRRAFGGPTNGPGPDR